MTTDMPQTDNWLDHLDIPLPSDDDMPPPEANMQTEAQYLMEEGSLEDLSPAPPPEPVEISSEDVDRCLVERFGLQSFREGQRDIIDTVLAGRSALGVMPTGAGKSLCYQLPAMLLPGVTLVISPLIALMKDQVDSLVSKGLPAAYINSTLTWPEQRERLEQMRRGELKMIFVAPERFRSGAFMRALSMVHVSLFVIDEAHCISEWGHDFRPDYTTLNQQRAKLGEPVTLALTATATQRVRKDILAQLGLRHADIFVSGFERPNLFMEVYRARGKRDKLARMEALLRHMGGNSIVYCATRKAVEEIAGELRDAGFGVGFYHGGLSDGQRDRVQDEFMNGAYEVLVATNAFGMGVDKSDIRAIVHYQIPSSLEAYYQEAGRAGRDGGASHCLLLYNYADRHVPDFFIQSAHPDKAVMEGLWQALQRQPQTYDTRALARQVRGKVSTMAVGSALRILRGAGHIDYQAQPGEPIEVVRSGRLQIDWQHQANRRRFEEEKLQKVIYYATGKRCRTMDMLRYFGSRASFDTNCGHCDLCVEVPPYASSAAAVSRKPKLVAGKSGGASSTSSAGKKRREGKGMAPIHTTEEYTTVVRKVLACIARGRQRLSVTMISRILIGSKSKNVLQYNHDKNSTYGLLSDLTAHQVVRLLDDMLEAKFLEVEGVCVRLTPLAVDVMKGSAELPEALDAVVKSRFKGGASQSASVRAKMAKMLGMGGSAGASSSSSSAKKSSGSSGKVTSTVAQTLAMLMDGKTIKEIASEREIKDQTVVRHVIKGARVGATKELDFEPYLDGAMLPVLRTLTESMEWEGNLKEFRDAVSEQLGGRRVEYNLMRMNLAYLIDQGELE